LSKKPLKALQTQMNDKVAEVASKFDYSRLNPEIPSDIVQACCGLDSPDKVAKVVAETLEKEPVLNGSITLHFQAGSLKKVETKIVTKI